MRVHLIKMDIESHNIILSIFIGHELVHILRPLFNILRSVDMGVVSTLVQIHLLVTEGYLVHPFPGSSKDEVHDCPEARHLQSFVGVFDAPGCQVLLHELWNALAGVDGTNHAATCHLEVQMLAREVIVAGAQSMVTGFLRPYPLFLVALCFGDAFTCPEVHDLFCCTHI